MNSAPPFSELAELRAINRRAGGCEGNCTFCSCADLVQSILDDHRVLLPDMIRVDRLPSEIVDSIRLAQSRKGERVEIRGDHEYIDAYRPFPRGFSSVSDDEL